MNDISYNRISLKSKIVPALLVTAVLLIVLAAHWPALSSEALVFDDDQYLLTNRLVQNPSWSSTGQFLSEILYPSTVRGYYQPLAMISLMLDYAAGGREDSPRPFRITSIALHLANVALVIVILHQLFGHFIVALLAGAIYGLHPLTIESIPWLSERKTLLATFFALWCLIFYLQYARAKKSHPLQKPPTTYYVLSILFFLLSLMSKPTTVLLPICMLLLDYWPMRRLSKPAILEKIPFFLIAFIAAIVTYLSQKNTCEVTLPTEYGPQRIPLILCYNIVFYLHKFLWPIRLSAYHPFPDPFSLAHPAVLAGVIGSIILLTALLISLRWTRAWCIGWLFFFTAIFPTLGIIGFHPVIAAERHTYLPMLGFILIIAWCLQKIIRHNHNHAFAKYLAIAIIVLAICTAETISLRRYLSNWQTTESLYKYMLSLSPDAATLHNNLSLALTKSNKYSEAIEHYSTSLRLKQDSHEVHNNLANLLRKVKQPEQAIHHYRRAIELTQDKKLLHNPQCGFFEAHINLAIILREQRRPDEALAHFEKALQLRAGHADTYNQYAQALSDCKQYDKAIDNYQEAIRRAPALARAYYNLGLVYTAQGKIDMAIAQFRQVLLLRPKDAEMHCNVGILLERTGRIPEAIEEYRLAIGYDPNLAKAQKHLQSALAEQQKQQPK